MKVESKVVTVEGHWMEEPERTYSVRVSLGSWDGVEDEKDRDIFYYTDGQPLNIGDVIADDFVITAIEGESK